MLLELDQLLRAGVLHKFKQQHILALDQVLVGNQEELVQGFEHLIQKHRIGLLQQLRIVLDDVVVYVQSHGFLLVAPAADVGVEPADLLPDIDLLSHEHLMQPVQYIGAGE